jgi:hypothetical protein
MLVKFNPEKEKLVEFTLEKQNFHNIFVLEWRNFIRKKNTAWAEILGDNNRLNLRY